MHYCEQLGMASSLERGFQPLRLNNTAPFGVDPMDLRAKTAGGVGQTLAECAVDRHDHFIPIFDEVSHRHLHSGRAGTRDGESDFVGGLENDAQQLFYIFHHADEVGIKMTDYRREHRFHYPGMNIGRSGPQQYARGRLQLRKRNRHVIPPVRNFSLVRNGMRAPRTPYLGCAPPSASIQRTSAAAANKQVRARSRPEVWLGTEGYPALPAILNFYDITVRVCEIRMGSYTSMITSNNQSPPEFSHRNNGPFIFFQAG